jgi:glucosylceramidase
MSAVAGAAGSATVPYALVTSVNGVWSTGMWTETSNATVDVVVNDTVVAQTWEGFGGAFHERGWNLLSTPELLDEASSLLFGPDGARFNIARIPIGASDYALERYTLDDTGTDVAPNSDDSSRPPADLALTGFSIARDEQTLIPYVQGALAKNPNLRFWAVAWTPPVWMKTGYKTNSNGDPSAQAEKPSYFDGGTIKSDAATLSAYAEYMVKFVQAYAAEGIAIGAISPQDEPTFDENYPSCTWDEPTYAKFVGQYLGPALLSANLDTKIMLGTLANEPDDDDLLTALMADTTVQPFVKSIGVEWNVLDKVKTAPLTYAVPVWVTEHKCGNYPFVAAPIAGTATSPPIPPYTQPPPNDQAYGVETWWYIRDAITKAKVTAYTFPHLVLDPIGLGNDTSRQWEQNSLLVVDNGTIIPTQAYYVARHFSEFVDPGANVVGTTGGDAVAFKNPDGSLVAVVFSAAAESDFTVAIGGKQLAFAIPAGGWATVKYTP